MAKDSTTKVTKIKAKNSSVNKTKPKSKPVATVDKTTRNPFKLVVNYIKGSWYELKQVHWPTRATTWSMTMAVLLFTTFFIILVLLLDTLFNWTFEQLLR